MDFTKGNEKRQILLEPRSLLIVSGEARYEWTHGIAARKSDVYEGQKIVRERRVSMTFRGVVSPNCVKLR
jgi:alkylated DNA repair dioxygenase AlkB